jgi:hypothetical protein
MELNPLNMLRSVLEYRNDTNLSTQTQEEFQEQLLYRTWADPMEQRLLRNKEHMRLLLASVDEHMEWVTFTFQNRPGFSQAGWRGDGLMVVEVNTVPLGYADRIIKADSGGAGDISSSNFGDMDALLAQEQHNAVEAFNICSLWMETSTLPDGYVKAPAEE